MVGQQVLLGGEILWFHSVTIGGSVFCQRNKLRIMFLRESEGVYRFGTKRIAIKCENNNIKIRVGGGYLSIEEFID